MGAWMFADRRLNFILEELQHRQRNILYVGRRPAAAPATGVHHHHEEEQELLVRQALSVPLADLPQPFRRVTRMGAIQYAK